MGITVQAQFWERRNMSMQYFGLFLLLVLIVNGAPKPDPKPSPKAGPKPIPKAAPKPIPKAAPKPIPNPKPIPKPDPKAKAQIFNNMRDGNGDGTGENGPTELTIGRIDNIIGDVNYPDGIGSIGTHRGGFDYRDNMGRIHPRGRRHLGGTYYDKCNG